MRQALRNRMWILAIEGGTEEGAIFGGKTAGIIRNKAKQCQRIAFSLTISNVIYMRTYAAPTVLLAVLTGCFTLLAFYFSFICIYSLLPSMLPLTAHLPPHIELNI